MAFNHSKKFKNNLGALKTKENNMRTKHFILPVIILIGILLPSCQKKPTACFDSAPSVPVIHYDVHFTNCSTEGSSYEWDFGDGSMSRLIAPSHAYENAGTYMVKLKAFSRNGHKSDECSKTIIIAGNGKISFWVSGSYPVNLTLQTQGAIIVYPCPQCSVPTDCSGGNSYSLLPGTYSYSAQEQSPGTGTWSGTVVITGGDCHLIQF